MASGSIIVNACLTDSGIVADVLEFSWWEISQSVTDNTTTVGWKLDLIAYKYGRINSSASKKWSVTFAGQSYSGTNTIGISANSTKTLASGTTVVSHESDGTKSFTFSFSQEIKINFGASSTYIGTKSGEGNGTLTTIARESVPTLSASTVKMNDALTITTNRKSISFTHTLKYAFGGTTVTIATGVGESYPWTVPDLASKINNAVSGTMTISCDTYNGSDKVGTRSVTLTVKVPDATVPSFPDGNVIIGTSNPIATSAGSTNFTHLITYSFNGKTGKVNEDQVKSGIVWWTPYSLASAIPSKTKGEGTITCTTYNGTAVVGSKAVSFTATVPDNSTTKPDFAESDFDLTPSGSIPSTFNGLYIQGKTGVKASFKASSTYSDISSYKLTADGRDYWGDTATSQTLTKPGDIPIKGTVYDARGYSTSRTKTITVLPYVAPSIEPHSGDSSVICRRRNEKGEYIDSGTRLHIRAKRKYAPVKVGDAQKNFCEIKYRYKLEDTDWTTYDTLLKIEDSDDDIDVELTNVVTQTDKSYLVQLVVTDTMGANIPYDFPIGTDKVTLHLREEGLGAAFGKYAEKNNCLECAWDLEVEKNTYIGGNVYQKKGTEWELQDRIIEQGKSGEWMYRKWLNGLLECWTEYIFKPINTGANEQTITYPITFAEDPIVQLTPGHNATLCSYVQNCNTSGNRPDIKSQLHMLVYGVTSTEWNIGINIYAVGKWK